MSRKSAGTEIERLIGLLARLPGLGHRSARKAALACSRGGSTCSSRWPRRSPKRRPRSSNAPAAATSIRVNPCTICQDPRRDATLIVVVEEIGDLWALERAGVVNSLYHVLGGHLSPLDGIGPDQLNIARLVERAVPRRSRRCCWRSMPRSRASRPRII